MHSCRRFCILLTLVGFPAAALAGDWTQFRGPHGDGVVEDAKLPAEWSEKSKVVWKVSLPGRGWSQPITSGGKLFVTTAVSEQEEKPRRGERGVVPGALDPRKHDYHWKLL